MTMTEANDKLEFVTRKEFDEALKKLYAELVGYATKGVLDQKINGLKGELLESTAIYTKEFSLPADGEGWTLNGPDANVYWHTVEGATRVIGGWVDGPSGGVASVYAEKEHPTLIFAHFHDLLSPTTVVACYYGKPPGSGH